MTRLIIIIFMLSPFCAISQDRIDMKQRADEFFRRFEYHKSAELYSSLLENGSNNILVKERLADCYRFMNNFTMAEKYYSQVVSSSQSSPSARFFYAEMLLTNGKISLAKKKYVEYFAKTKNQKLASLKLNSCDSAEKWSLNPRKLVVTAAQKFNTNASEWGVVLLPDSSVMFLSDRFSGTNLTEYTWTGQSWIKPYYVNSRDIVTPSPVFEDLVAKGYHVGPVAYSKDGNSDFITVTTFADKQDIRLDQKNPKIYTRRLEILIASKEHGKWTKFDTFPFNNKNEWSTGHVALSPDGKVLYFVSDRPGGFGKTDIWFSTLLENGKWDEPKNCGATINTAEEEAFITINGDGKLYFSSKGLPGMGGYDLFSASGSRDVWSQPENLRTPINSTADDFWLATRDGINGYFSSNRAGGKGSDDIYSFKPTPDITERSRGNNIVLSGNPLLIGSEIVLRDIYYDLDKHDIRPDAAKILDTLWVILRDNPEMKIELSSHTDSRASENYNLDLSQRRADAAVQYLVKKGISAARIVARGYGESKLLNRCKDEVDCTEEEHQLNRRTEVKRIE